MESGREESMLAETKGSSQRWRRGQSVRGGQQQQEKKEVIDGAFNVDRKHGGLGGKSQSWGEDAHARSNRSHERALGARRALVVTQLGREDAFQRNLVGALHMDLQLGETPLYGGSDCSKKKGNWNQSFCQ